MIDPPDGVWKRRKKRENVEQGKIEQFKEAVAQCNDLAPLHNPANLIGINACKELMPGVPMVAVFDTAFHQTMPDVAYTYGIPYEYYEKYKVRRYGFHGTSHSYVSKRTAEIVGKPYDQMKIIVCHLGNGASISAVNCGKSVDTSMGLTPLEGLVMGTRSGDLDPAIIDFVGDTVRSIIISANSRLAFLENKQVLRLLSKDELNLSDIGIGVNGDGETKTALFCVIPDSDKSYNFIIGMLYTQIFQELYYQADFNCGGRLPIHVTFMLDEFANVALPDDFCSLLSTMRSREISSIIIIQNFAQLKALFKDTWETIPGNCDTFIYLGGNEQSTHKYVSELLGKGTIDKKSSGETKGRQGSSSRNYDVLGRELFTPDEVRKLDNKKCIIFIRGFDPIMDNKFIPFNHPMFNQTADGKGEPYVHQIRGADNLIGPPFEILSDKAVKYYEKLKDKGENVYIDSLTYEQFMMLGDAELSRRFSMQDEAEQKAKIDREQANELEYVDESQKSDAAESANASNGSAGGKPVRNPDREKPKWEDTITNRMLHWSYTPEQKEEVKKALAAGVPKATILTYFYPEVTVEKMSSYRKKH